MSAEMKDVQEGQGGTEGRKAGTRCMQWAVKTASLACLAYISLQWLASMSGQQRLQLPGWLLANHSTAATWTIHIIAAVLTIVLLVKLMFVAKVSMKLLLGFAARRSSDCLIPDDHHRGRSPFPSAGGIISQRSTWSSGGGAVANSSDSGGNILSFGFELSKAAQDMLRCSATGAVKTINAMLPYSRMNSATNRLSSGGNTLDLLEALPSKSTQKFGGSPQFKAIPISTAIPISSYGSNRSGGLRPSIPGAYRRLSECLSSESLLNSISAEAQQAYSEVLEHDGQFLVLHIDKDPIDRSVVQLLLESGHNNATQFKVVTAKSGKEALGLIFSSSFLPDVVLMDTMLPDMKASEVCKTLRASFSAVQLAIVLVTGRNGESDALAALDNGVNDFILKPLRQVELLARINSQIKVKQSIKREAESRSHYDLLVQILPPHIIARLAQGKYAPEQHEQVTILFSDIVGFTELCSRWRTPQVVTMLDIMFSCFDDLCDKHGAFKVETVGDAYMVASGHEGSKDHALRLAAMAVDMLESMQGLEERIGAPVRIRIGMHTGPALSGIVGKRRPRYCFFGDTVNTASRMESTGHPMTIQISEACRRSMLAATDAQSATVAQTAAEGPSITASDAAAIVLRRPAPSVISLADVHKSDFFLSTSPKGSGLLNEASGRASPPHGSGPSTLTVSRTPSSKHRCRRSNSSRHSSGSELSSQRPSLELSRAGQQQAAATSNASRLSHEKLPHRYSSGSRLSSQRPSLELSRADQQQAAATSHASRLSHEKLPHRYSSGSRSSSQRPSLELSRADQQQAVATFSANRQSLEQLPHRDSGSSKLSSHRTSLELSRAGQQQAVVTFLTSLHLPEKLPHNSMIAAPCPSETTLNGSEEEFAEGGSHALPSEPESDSSADSSDSASSSQIVRRQLLIQGHVALKLHSGGIADGGALGAAAGSQSPVDVSESSEAKVPGVGDSWLMVAAPEEQHSGLPWGIVNLGLRSVKGKGSMKTHLLKVGSWQQAVLAIRAEQEGTRLNAPIPATGTTST